MPKRIEKRNKKRIQVPLMPEVIAVIDDLALTMGSSAGGVCEQMLTEAVPAMRQLTMTLKRLQLTPDDGLGINVRGLVEELERAVGEARQTSLDLEQKMS
tara:strand:+ start:92 stop:391 length:300 start_codon:yes stop_codon:yes gene_type:complete